MRILFTACHKRNRYKLFSIRIIFAILIIYSNCTVATAQYPVRSQTIIKSPYSVALSDYYTGSDSRLQLVLTNSDIREPIISVRLQLSIVSNRVNLRNRTVVGPIIQLDAGVPVFLSGTDLAIYFNPANIDVLSGLDYNALSKSPRLPDGTYTFRFDVVDAFTGRLLSDPKSIQSPINILSIDPPLLNVPRKGDNIRYTDPLNIIFNWTPRAANKGITEYTFSLYEILDNGMPPENVPFMSQPIYQTTTSTTTLLYGSTEPPLLPGKRYAWRIRAVAKQGIDSYSIYNNDGYTETYWFQLNDNCDPPQQISATIRGGAVTLEWPENPNMYEYTVEYKKKGDWNTWFSTNTKTNRIIITDVSAGNTYEYRVGGICTVGAGATFSDMRAFTIPPRDSVSNKQCGILPNINISNQKKLETLKVGDLVKVGDYQVTILSLTSASNGSFSGTAALTMNILNIIDARIKVMFNNVVFNTDKQLIKGFMVTSYDKTGKQIGDLDKVFEGGGDVGKVKDGRDAADITVDFPINNPADIHVQMNSTEGTIQIDITGANGETKKITVQNLPTTIKDSEGNIYNIDKNGKVTKVGKSGEFKNLNTAQLNAISVDKAVVSFVPHNQQQYAFDQWKDLYNKSRLFKEPYEALTSSTGSEAVYYVSAKAIEAGKTDFIKATIDIKDGSVKPDNVRFITGKGTRFESKYVGNNEYEITIVGGPAGDAQELYALYPNASSNGDYLSFGKLLIASYSHKKQKLILVPVNGTTVDKNSIAQQLNAIYNKIAVEFDVQQDANFSDNSWDINNDGALQVDGSGLFSTLTDEMEALNNAYRSKRTVEEKTIYLFVLPKASSSNVVGDMPRAKQFGYLFSSPFGGVEGATVAHEVGHGLFNLKHTFDSQYGFEKGELGNNVMDYPSGSTFSKLQWNAIHDPGLVIGLFESDGDAKNIEIFQIQKLLDFIKNNKNSDNINFKRADYYSVIYDFAQSIKSYVPVELSTGKRIKVFVDFKVADGILDFSLNNNDSYNGIGLNIDLKDQYHTGFYINFRSKDKKVLFELWTKSYDEFESLLKYLDFRISDPNFFINKYKLAIQEANGDCNKLDVLYENMPPFVIESIADEDLWIHLVSISSCSMGASQGTDEEKAALNIMRGFKDRKKLYDKLYQNSQVVEKLYSGIDGDNCLSYLNILVTLTNNYGKKPTEKQYAYFGKVPNNKYPNNSSFNGQDYLTKVENNTNGLITISTVVTGDTILSHLEPPIKKQLSINDFEVDNLLDQGIVYKDEEKNMDILPIIFIRHLAAKHRNEELLSAINKISMVFGFWGSTRVLFATEAGYLAKSIAFSELSKLAIDAYMSSEANRKEISSWGSESKWIVDNWNTISTGVDVITLGGQLLVNFIKNGAKVSSKLKARGMDKEAEELDEMIKKASTVTGVRKYWRTATEMRDDVMAWTKAYRKKLPSNSQLTDFNKACAASYKKADGSIETMFGRNGGVLNTQKSYPTISAEKGLGLHPELQKRLPANTKWPNVANCAECDAVNQALHNGAKWEDIQIHTIDIRLNGTMTDRIRCSECQDIFNNMYVTSE